MTIRLGVLPYGPSDSCRDLRNALVEAFANINEVTPRMINTQNSEFRGRALGRRNRHRGSDQRKDQSDHPLHPADPPRAGRRYARKVHL